MKNRKLNRKSSTSNSVLASVNWKRIGRRVVREQSHREDHAPVISAYRWWARRSHAVMGAILDSAIKHYGKDMSVSDPFSGGGTVTYEAVRRNLSVYAQDLYPWPSDGLATSLTPTDLTLLRDASEKLLSHLNVKSSLYRRGDGREISHILRVRKCRCTKCRRCIYMFPRALVSLASRSSTETEGYFGCVGCGRLSLRNKENPYPRCGACRKRLIDGETLSECPHCQSTLSIKALLRSTVRWQVVLVQEIEHVRGRAHACLRPVESGDPVGSHSATGLNVELEERIGDGKETRRLADLGYKTWGDLYSKRQVTIINEALLFIRSLSEPKSVKDRLAFAVLGLAEMPAFLSRWDRFHLKPFEATANHRYAHTTFSVETNPISPVGRGTLARRLNSACSALEWILKEGSGLHDIKRVRPGGRRPLRNSTRIFVATGSSVTQALPNNCTHLTLTDPPYYDDVQYGELARIFHVWLAMYRTNLSVDESLEVTPNSIRGHSRDDYERSITKCFAESRRTLAKNGRLVLTYHNSKMSAWETLANALFKSQFLPVAIAVVHSENRGDHSKRYKGSILHDLVIECVPTSSRLSKAALKIVVEPASIAEKNLVAMGKAMSHAIRNHSLYNLQQHYRDELIRMGVSRFLVS